MIAPCPHRPPCQACPRYGDPSIAPGASEALAALAAAQGLPPVPAVAGAGSGFRVRARLAIRGRVGAPKVGLFEPGTHRVVHVPGCVIHHPLVNRVAEVVRRALADAGVSCYSERAHLGLARYLQVVIERSSQTAQVVLVGNSETAEPFGEALAMIRERLGPELHSLWFNSQCGQSNVILGPLFERVCGPASVVERFGGAAVHYPPGAFGQSNLEVAGEIIAQLRTQLPQGAHVIEFYAGVGAIGLSLLAQTGSVAMNEVHPQSLAGLELGLAGLDAQERARACVLPGGAGAAAHAVAAAEVVIADPPRKGLDPALLAALIEHPPERFFYVSCGLESFLADTARLVTDGRMRLAALTAYNLMPYTAHVETLARFEPRD
jgi:tRNA/tmRNA/rRNA uracil-C5-methylase (TrmA/RlmC/RlmD family)